MASSLIAWLRNVLIVLTSRRSLVLQVVHLSACEQYTIAHITDYTVNDGFPARQAMTYQGPLGKRVLKLKLWEGQRDAVTECGDAYYQFRNVKGKLDGDGSLIGVLNGDEECVHLLSPSDGSLAELME